MEEEILTLLKDGEHYGIETIMSHFNQTTTSQFIALVKLMNQLIEEGKVTQDGIDRYCLPEFLNRYVGVLSLHKNGFGFVSIGEEENDIFIGKDYLKDAFDKDTVMIELLPSSSKAHQEGKIVEVLKRGQTRVVGEVHQGKKDCYIIVDDPTFKKKIVVDHAHLHGAMPGHKVVVEIKAYKPYIKGDVVSIIGHKLDPGIDVLSVVYKHDASITFPKQVMEQVAKIPSHIDQSDIKNRVDLRDEVIVTIDGDDAKDLDDAISLKKLDNGNYYLGVHIADVSYYVTEGSPLDKEAITRGISIYLVDRVIPMLPHKLSNGICSLNPDVDRFAITCYMELDETGEVIDYRIIPSVIHSHARMTYTNVNKILAGDKEQTDRYQELTDLFFLMEELASILQEKRDHRGAINFDAKEGKVIVDKKGKPIDVVIRDRGISDRIIEEFMLLANETVAKHFYYLELPFIYRVHEYPKAQKLQQFALMAAALGYQIKGSLDHVYPHELKAILDESKDTPEQSIISTLLLRSMQKARYDEQCLGHYGLADDHYTHFTSPIRRYPDLLVHRLIRTYLFKEQVDDRTLQHYQQEIPALAMQASIKERDAITIEREVDDMKIAEYMEDKIGQVFEGIISSVTKFGFFVELDNTIEGLVHVSDLTDDYYTFDEKHLCYIGERTKKVFKMSDRIKVKVKAASKAEKIVDFEVVGIKPHKRTRKTVIINKGKSNKKVTRRKKGKRRYRR